MRVRAVVSLIALDLIAGCGGSAGTPPPTAPVPVSSPGGGAPATTPEASAPSPLPSPSKPAAPSASPANEQPPASAPAGSTVLMMGPSDSQAVVIAPSGRRVLIDVVNPEALPAKPTSRDFLLTTHSHEDHYLADFVDAFPGQTLTMRAGTLAADDVKVTGIRGEHHEDATLSIPNYLFVVDVAGLRIVDFGDLGQDSLTRAQLDAIGQPDVLIAQLSNSFSDMYVANRKGVNLVNQVHPRLLIPTHMIEDPVATAKMAAAEWSASWTARSWITITSDRLPAATSVLFMGGSGPAYGKITKAPEASW